MDIEAKKILTLTILILPFAWVITSLLLSLLKKNPKPTRKQKAKHFADLASNHESYRKMRSKVRDMLEPKR